MPHARGLGALLAFAMACAGAQHAPAASARPAPRLYVSNEDSNDISVIDTGRDEVVATLAVGKRPRGLRLSPGGDLLYVAVSGTPRTPPGKARQVGAANREADGIAVVDLARGAVARVLPSGVDPENFDLSPDGRLLYVSNEEAETASVVDVAAGRVIAAPPVGDEPEGVATRPDGGAVYVTSERASRVTVLGPRGEILGSFSTGNRPRNVAFTHDGSLAFITAEEGAQVTVVDARAHAVLGTIHIDAPHARPMGMAVAPDGRTLFVSNGRVGSVTAIDVASRKQTRTFETGGERSWGLAISGDGAKLYVANGGTDEVAVVDVASGRVLKHIPVGSKPWGLALGK
jgi:YVTN family beta-propeller protein